MGRCLNLTRAGEYAIAALSRLALSEAGTVPARELARVQRIPEPFLAKILVRCARAGLVRATKGASGGVRLSRRAEEIALLEIVEACEGAYARESCVFYASRACDGPACEVYCPLRREEEALRAALGRRTLAEMAASLADHPENAAREAVTGGERWMPR